MQTTTETFHRNPARMLDTAEGVLIALRRYTPAEAFAEILEISRIHGVPTLGLARALVDLAGDRIGDDPDGTASVAQIAWGHLFVRPASLPASV